MPFLSDTSKEELYKCHGLLAMIIEQVVQNYDLRVLEGRRNKQEQQKMVRQGKSQLEYPDSKHNWKPSMAVDIAPYPIDWQVQQQKVRDRWLRLLHQVRITATHEGIPITLGIDWDMDADYSDHSFHDYPHVELNVEEMKERGLLSESDYTIPEE